MQVISQGLFKVCAVITMYGVVPSFSLLCLTLPVRAPRKALHLNSRAKCTKTPSFGEVPASKTAVTGTCTSMNHATNMFSRNLFT